MQQRTRITIDNNNVDDDDDDDDVKQEVTNTIEKFVQSRHVQTLKYLRHVIDENRHLRLHIEHLKRRQDIPVKSPANIDSIEPEEIPITEIPLGTPELILDLEHIDEATNTEGDDYETKYHILNDELINLKKQHNINREEYQRELERVDHQNIQLEKDLKIAQQQLIIVQKSVNDKQIEIQNLTTINSDQKLFNEALNIRINKFEQTNRLLVQSLTISEETHLELEKQLNELQQTYHQTEENLSELQIQYKNIQTYLQTSEHDVELLKEKLNIQLNKCQELKNDNEELKETIKYLQQQIQEKIHQEEQYIREKQLNSNFKDFVQVKRTLQICQQENEQLKVELKKLQIKFLNKNE
ncbi:unnamed protein product [Rotaria sp. Silwood1]|nr:unnamed protein product [Rotaria sp. Silwood1]CAF1135601.1 unnamed protein product [Rotaria sp. Silwood1]CAF3446724.1 unnamed protein product [Rotaria sp. Silwood1]CAF3452917.1 unnamed protein product [Rotaria sp. Silwood1]CAF4855498.1 unnamed protein product [Rotaria sp. Silwood1]